MFTSCVQVYDPMRVVRNVADGISGVMDFYDAYLEGLTVVTKMLRKLWSRQRLSETCSAGDLSPLKDTLKGVEAKVRSKRWKSVAVFSFELDPREEI